CGDGAKQSPNQVGTGGPLNDGYEDCDGTDGVGAHQQCTSQCVLENLTFCGDGTVQKPNDDGFDEQCDGQAGVGEHQQCTDQCILIDLTYCGDGNIQTPNDDGFDEQCEVDTDCNDENSNTTDVCNLCTCEFHGQTFCGDGIKQSPNEEGSGGPQNDGYEGCDGADGVGAHQQCTSQCVLENLPYCGDGTVDPGEACDDGNNTSGDGCSASCKNEGCVGYCGGGKVTYDPRLLMNKTVDHVFVYPNQEIIYTLEITNIGNEVGENLTVTDSLPEGFTYATTSETIVVWDLGNIASYETKKISYPVKVGAGVLPGIYENNALAKITNVGPPDNVAYGSVEVEVREPTEADFPILSLEKSHEAPYAKAGDEVAYLLKVSNSGEGTAYEVKLNDVLPADFITKGGITEWVIGDIGPGEIKTVEYVVIVGNDVSPGEYQNTVTLSSTNHDDLEASAVLKIIFEELPDTGNGKQMIIYFLGGLFVICSSAYVYFDSKKYISSNI
ncbi:DUF11 domain-containing protein, partial [Patescibacteria group bacterium]|nr:DUF11 domain-containing protein [Patescibacteria group bacterium]